MKINYCFLQGIMADLTDRASIPLEIVGDENVITLKKGQGFDTWITDATPIVDPDAPGGVTALCAMNRRRLAEVIESWLDGVEYEG